LFQRSARHRRQQLIMNGRWWLLLAMVCLTPGCSAPAVSPPPPAPLELVVASDLDNMPFAGVDAAGRPQGRDVEMMVALAAQLGRPLRWERMPFDQLLAAVQTSTVDLICATMGITSEREEVVDFSDPYFSTAIEVVVRRGPGEPRRWADLDGRKVAAGQGTTSERAVRRVLPQAVGVYENKSQQGAYERLTSGAVDGLAMDGPNALDLVRQHGDELTLLLTPLAAERYGLVVGSGQLALRSAINRGLVALRRDGTIAALDARWGLQPTD